MLFCFLRKNENLAVSPLNPCKVSARRAEYKANREAFAFIPEPQPNLGVSQSVQGERNTKQIAKHLLLFDNSGCCLPTLFSLRAVHPDGLLPWSRGDAFRQRGRKHAACFHTPHRFAELPCLRGAVPSGGFACFVLSS